MRCVDGVRVVAKVRGKEEVVSCAGARGEHSHGRQRETPLCRGTSCCRQRACITYACALPMLPRPPRDCVCIYGDPTRNPGVARCLRLKNMLCLRVRTPHFGAERVWAQGIVAAHEPRRQGRVGARPGAGGQRRLPQGNRHQRGCHAGDLATLACASSITMQAKCHLLTELGTMRALHSQRAAIAHHGYVFTPAPPLSQTTVKSSDGEGGEMTKAWTKDSVLDVSSSGSSSSFAPLHSTAPMRAGSSRPRSHHRRPLHPTRPSCQPPSCCARRQLAPLHLPSSAADAAACRCLDLSPTPVCRDICSAR